MTRDISGGIQRAGSYTCRTPTIALMPLQIRKSAISRDRRSGVRTNEPAQKIGAITERYKTNWARPANVDTVNGWKNITTRYARAANIHGCTRCGRDVFATATAHHPSVAKEIANEATRMYSRNGCVPGK